MVSITVVGVKAVTSLESAFVVEEIVERVLLNFLCDTKVERVVGGTFIGDGVFSVWSVSAAVKNKYEKLNDSFIYFRQSIF